MKIAIFGGTFNPVHNGHVKVVDEITKIDKFDKIVIVPDRIPPHKSSKELVNGIHRLNMCKLAFCGFENVSVSDWEIENKGKSYSVVTLRHFKQVYPNDELFLVMGSDMMLNFDKWYKYQEILSLSSIVCISRCAADCVMLEQCVNKFRQYGGKIKIIPVKPLEISSSQIRMRLKKNLDCSCYLNKNVVQYIKDEKLYV